MLLHVSTDPTSFSKTNTPILDQNLAKELERPITAIDLEAAGRSLQSGKSLGPDGFPAKDILEAAGPLSLRDVY